MTRVQVQRWRFLVRCAGAMFVLLPFEACYIFPIYTRVEARGGLSGVENMGFNLLFFALTLSVAYVFGLFMGFITGFFIRVKD